MDPLSITVGVVSLVSSATKLSISLNEFLTDFREAQRDLEELLRQLNDLTLVVARLQDPRTIAALPDSLTADLGQVLEHCNRRIIITEEHLRKASTRKMRGAYWAFSGKKECGDNTRALEAHKSTINVTLSLCTVLASGTINAKADQIITEIRMLRQDTSGKDYVLQRFLESSETYAETVIGSFTYIEGDLDGHAEALHNEEAPPPPGTSYTPPVAQMADLQESSSSSQLLGSQAHPSPAQTASPMSPVQIMTAENTTTNRAQERSNESTFLAGEFSAARHPQGAPTRFSADEVFAADPTVVYASREMPIPPPSLANKTGGRIDSRGMDLDEAQNVAEPPRKHTFPHKMDEYVDCMAFSPDEKWLAVTTSVQSTTGTKVYDVDKGTVFPLQGHKLPEPQTRRRCVLMFLPGNESAIAASYCGQVMHIWQYRAERQIVRLRGSWVFNHSIVSNVHFEHAVPIGTNELLLLSASERRCEIWEIRAWAGNLVQTLPIEMPESTPWSHVSIAPHSSLVAIAWLEEADYDESPGFSARVFKPVKRYTKSTHTGEWSFHVDKLPEMVGSEHLVLSRHAWYIAYAARNSNYSLTIKHRVSDRQVVCFPDINAREQLHMERGAFSPGDQWLVAAGKPNSRYMYLIPTEMWNTMKRFKVEHGCIGIPVFSADGRMLACEVGLKEKREDGDTGVVVWTLPEWGF